MTKDNNNSNPDLYGNLNDKISELNGYFEKLLTEISKINEGTNQTEDLITLVAEMKTKVNTLESETLNEEE